ncbi:hypothetical protein NQ012_12745, partial [Neisseria dentiae]
DGFQANIKEHTDLKGGIITATEAAEQNGRNRFQTATLSHSDIENHSRYQGEGYGIGMSGSVSGERLGQNQSMGGINLYDASAATGSGAANGSREGYSQSIGFGRDGDNRSSVTRSGIGTRNIVIANDTTGGQAQAVYTATRSETAEQNTGRLNNTFDKDRVQKELDIQREVTQQFGQNAAQGVARLSDYLGNTRDFQRAEMLQSAIESELATTQDPQRRQQLQQALSQTNAYLADNQTAYNTWKEGGLGRSLLHAGAGGLLTGNLSGAAAAGSTSLAAPYLNRAGESLGGAGKAVIDTLGGAAIGWAAGGNAASAIAGANTDRFNRQLHPSERQLIKKHAEAMQAHVKKVEGKNISLAEAELRLQKQVLRWVNQDSQDGYTDYTAMAVLPMKGSDKGLGLNWDYRNYARRHPNEYADKYMYKEYFPQDGRGSNYWRLNWLHSGESNQAIRNRENANKNLAIGAAGVLTAPVGASTAAGRTAFQWGTSHLGREALKNATIGGAISAGSQQLSDGKINPTATVVDAVASGVGSRFGLAGQTATNVSGSVVSGVLQGKSATEIGADAVGTAVGTAVGNKVGQGIQNRANRYYNPLGKPDWVYRVGNPLLHYNVSDIPAILGTTVGGALGETTKTGTQKLINNINENKGE